MKKTSSWDQERFPFVWKNREEFSAKYAHVDQYWGLNGGKGYKDYDRPHYNDPVTMEAHPVHEPV